ncbi:MAG: hypothetical protein LRY38_09420 [Aeromonadaceae bacterium]|nr:hypothetical protein [Aeromonadaceae bacterium]
MQIDTLTLTDDFEWTDEFTWSRFVEERDYSAGGALLRTVSERLAGRPVTLTGGDSAWMTRAEFATLRALADSNPDSLTLTLWDGRTFTVAFDYSNGAPVTAEPVVKLTDPDDTQQLQNITIKLIAVE